MFKKGENSVDQSAKVSGIGLQQVQKGNTAVSTALAAMKLGDAVMESKPLNALVDEVKSWGSGSDVEHPGKAISDSRAGKPPTVKPAIGPTPAPSAGPAPTLRGQAAGVASGIAGATPPPAKAGGHDFSTVEGWRSAGASLNANKKKRSEAANALARGEKGAAVDRMRAARRDFVAEDVAANQRDNAFKDTGMVPGGDGATYGDLRKLVKQTFDRHGGGAMDELPLVMRQYGLASAEQEWAQEALREMMAAATPSDPLGIKPDAVRDTKPVLDAFGRWHGETYGDLRKLLKTLHDKHGGDAMYKLQRGSDGLPWARAWGGVGGTMGAAEQKWAQAELRKMWADDPSTDNSRNPHMASYVDALAGRVDDWLGGLFESGTLTKPESGEFVQSFEEPVQMAAAAEAMAAEIVGSTPERADVSAPAGSSASAFSTTPSEMTKRVADSSHRGVDRQFTERAMEASSAAGDPVRLQPMDFAETVLRAAQKIADERRKPFPTPVELQSMSVSGLIAQAEVRELTNAQFQELDYYVGEAAVSNGLMNLGGQRYIREARKRLAKAYAKGSAGERSASNPTQIAKDLMTIHMKGARMRNYNASADSKTVSSHWDAQMGKAKTANLWANLMTDKDFQKHLTKKSIVSSGSTPIEWAVDDYHYGRSIDSPKNMKILQELDGLIAKGTRRQKNAAQATKTSILKTVGTKIDADNLVGRVEYWEDQSELIDAKITKLEAEEEKARKGKAPKNPKRLKVIRAISFLKGRIQDANGRMKLIKQSGRTRSAAKTIDDELKGYRRKILKEEKKLDELPPEAGNKPAERPKSKRTNVWIDPETGKKGSERAFLAAVSRDEIPEADIDRFSRGY
tara:strand:- start:11635 stop:14196 length:2562 start_codon:yes stop_codon:yes gene_type:complete